MRLQGELVMWVSWWLALSATFASLLWALIVSRHVVRDYNDWKQMGETRKYFKRKYLEDSDYFCCEDCG